MDKFKCITHKEAVLFGKAATFAAVAALLLYIPFGDPRVECNPVRMKEAFKNNMPMCLLCNLYLTANRMAATIKDMSGTAFCYMLDFIYEAKLQMYMMLEKVDGGDVCSVICRQSEMTMHLLNAMEVSKEDIDKALEDGITQRLGEDLLQSIEKKFHVDLERSVDIVLEKIKMLLQNGTHHIQNKLTELQRMLEDVKSRAPAEAEACLLQSNNETAALAEKALHQMVVCGYALIGQDPSMAVNRVLALKSMIKNEMEPIRVHKLEIYDLLRVCGHEHDTLKKVIKCVISKSSTLKSVMMEISGKLVEGTVELTKMIAHGAMHEACLIEVVKAVEDEALKLVTTVRKCANYESKINEVDNYISENNATVLDVANKERKKRKADKVPDVQELLRKMLNENDTLLDDGFKDKLNDLHKNFNEDVFKDLDNAN